jgi:hypothetical protein
VRPQQRRLAGHGLALAEHQGGVIEQMMDLMKRGESSRTDRYLRSLMKKSKR